MPDGSIDLSGGSLASESPATRRVGPERWAHLPAVAAFGVLFIALRGHPWRWYISVDAAYTVYVYWYAIGSVCQDFDDVTGNPDILRLAVKTLPVHAVAIAICTCGVFEWFYLEKSLPAWATTAGRKASVWAYFGWLVLSCSGIYQGTWLGRRLKKGLESAQS